MTEATIITQINLHTLTDRFSNTQIENALVNIFIESHHIITKNELLTGYLISNDRTVIESTKEFLNSKRIELDLPTIQKLFELLLEKTEKKTSGTFYTPYSVVNFIVSNSIEHNNCKVIDPSCGCGAFLIGATNIIKNTTTRKVIDIIENNIFGADISEEAIRRTKIALSLFALMNNEDKEHIKFNLVQENSLFLDWATKFPEIFKNGGFDIVIGNPPYTLIPQKYDLTQLSTKYEVIGGNSAPNMYVIFLELMMKLTKNNGMMGVIVPLSIAFNSEKSFIKLREILEDFGESKFSFYDRSPDSLFGDHIKTRNCILLSRKSNRTHAIHTTKLIRWNSKNRETLFKNIEYQELKNIPLKKAIPKISTSVELEVIRKLSRLKPLGNNISIHKNNNVDAPQYLYFYNTAYNWLSVFKHPPLSFDNSKGNVILSSISAIDCHTEENAKVIYSLLNNNLTYWYWVVWGDGFHLTHKFIQSVPADLNNISRKTKEKLIRYAEELDREVKRYPISKVNNGLTIGNYNILMCNELITSIDKLLIEEFGLSNEFLDFLIKFRKEHISAGREKFKNSNIFL